MLNTDFEATKAAKFRNKSSRVLLDGREILGRLDYNDRKLEIWKEQGGACANNFRPHMILRWQDGELHHVMKRSKLRDDRKSNLKLLCWYCHRKEHGQA